jgi:hypothetical protein
MSFEQMSRNASIRLAGGGAPPDRARNDPNTDPSRIRKFKLRADAIQAEAVALFMAYRHKITVFYSNKKYHTSQYRKTADV